MNWDAIGAIGQVLGSLAVCVTLGYLATQVRQARRQMQRAATDNRAATVRQLMLTQLTNERRMSIFEKVTPGGQLLTRSRSRWGWPPRKRTRGSLGRAFGSSIERRPFPTSTICRRGSERHLMRRRCV
jgi:hypothetical protein